VDEAYIFDPNSEVLLQLVCCPETLA